MCGKSTSPSQAPCSPYKEAITVFPSKFSFFSISLLMLTIFFTPRRRLSSSWEMFKMQSSAADLYHWSQDGGNVMCVISVSDWHYNRVVHFLSRSLKRSRYSRHNSISATMNMSTGHVCLFGRQEVGRGRVKGQR